MQEDQACPLCMGKAECWVEDFGNRLHFFCERCGEFEVSRKVKDLLSTSQAMRDSSLQKVQAAPPNTFAEFTFRFGTGIALEYQQKRNPGS